MPSLDSRDDQNPLELRKSGESLNDRSGSMNGPKTTSALSPLHSHLRTLVGAARRSHLCHVWTAPDWQGLSSRPQAGRCSHVFGLT